MHRLLHTNFLKHATEHVLRFLLFSHPSQRLVCWLKNYPTWLEDCVRSPWNFHRDILSQPKTYSRTDTHRHRHISTHRRACTRIHTHTHKSDTHTHTHTHRSTHIRLKSYWTLEKNNTLDFEHKRQGNSPPDAIYPQYIRQKQQKNKRAQGEHTD